jgi:rhamnosyl/mannosyltransferase
LRVIHLGKFYPPAAGGIETYTRTLARAQADLGAEVRVAVVNHADARGLDVTFEATALTADASDADGEVRVFRVGRVASAARFDVAPGLPRLFRRLLREPPDVWHLHTPNPTMLLATAASPRIRPLVVTHHSDVVRQRVLRTAVRPFERVVYARAARLLPTSPAYAAASPPLRAFAEKLEVLPLGIDLGPFLQPSPEALAAARSARERYPGPIWLSVGRLAYYKGLNVAVRALRHVPGTLVVVGTGPMAGEWQRLAEDLGVAGRVVWNGRTGDDELVGLYRAATGLWFPSNARSEAFGLVQVEAMASGCPVVNTAIPGSGVPWVCRDGEAGLTVPVNEPTAFAAAARRLLDEPGLRERLAAEGVRQACDRFDHRVVAKRSLELYAEAAGR